MNAPSFSVVIETANLSLADLDGLRVTLESLADQSLAIQTALDVLIMDSGDVPHDLLEKALVRYPWARVIRLPGGTGYEELKMAGAAAAAGDVIVFADGDCFYDPGWLEALLAPFSDPSVSIVGGETSIDSAGPYGFANVIVSSFPARSSSSGLYTADRYHLNNVAFRRSVLERIPIPTRRPCYRMSGLHAAALLAGGYTIRRQPAARTRHASPNGLHHFIWRFLLLGYDGVVVPRLIASETHKSSRAGEQRRRTLNLVRFWTVQSVAKLVGELRRQPSRILSLPLAVPVIAAAVLLQGAGALGGLLAPERLLGAVPDDILRSSTCQPGPVR